MKLVAVVHNVRSLHNVGAILRTADGAGFSKVYLTGITPSPLDRFGKVRPQVAKVSLGAEKSLSWEKVTSAARLFKKLKKEGYRIIALEQAKGAVPYYEVEWGKGEGGKRKGKVKGGSVALVVGNEVKGLPASVLKLADEVLEIPMRGAKESLNVSVAFGIAAYQLAVLP
jgi:tRNA G18 (ribose-2'-O)-methylase SpoU